MFCSARRLIRSHERNIRAGIFKQSILHWQLGNGFDIGIPNRVIASARFSCYFFFRVFLIGADSIASMTHGLAGPPFEVHNKTFAFVRRIQVGKQNKFFLRLFVCLSLYIYLKQRKCARKICFFRLF